MSAEQNKLVRSPNGGGGSARGRDLEALFDLVAEVNGNVAVLGKKIDSVDDKVNNVIKIINERC